MVRAFRRAESTILKSIHLKRMFESPGNQVQSLDLESEAENTSSKEQITASPANKEKTPVEPSDATPPRKVPTDMDLMKEKFAKLLLGEDMSGGGKGVSSALALSNAITNLAASVFGEQKKLEPMSPDRRSRWKREIDWLLSVTDYIVEFVASQQSNNGVNMEVMTTRQRGDLLMNIPALRKLDNILVEQLDSCANQTEFWYVSRDKDDDEAMRRNEDKWWIPTVKVPPNGLSESTRKWLQSQKDAVNQVHKAAMAINAQVLSDMEIPESYIEKLPKNGRSSLGDVVYKGITGETFDPDQLLSNVDLSTEHKVVDLKNRMEASIVIWKRKMNQKDGKSSWGSAVSLEKREQFEERAETILLILKLRYPGISQSTLDISKIQYNKDVGHAILESYSRVIESLAYTILSRIEDVIYADSLTQDSDSNARSEEDGDIVTPSGARTLSDFMGWGREPSEMKNSVETYCKGESDKPSLKPVTAPRKFSYLEKLENLSGLRSPTARH